MHKFLPIIMLFGLIVSCGEDEEKLRTLSVSFNEDPSDERKWVLVTSGDGQAFDYAELKVPGPIQITVPATPFQLHIITSREFPSNYFTQVSTYDQVNLNAIYVQFVPIANTKVDLNISNVAASSVLTFGRPFHTNTFGSSGTVYITDMLLNEPDDKIFVSVQGPNYPLQRFAFVSKPEDGSAIELDANDFAEMSVQTVSAEPFELFRSQIWGISGPSLTAPVFVSFVNTDFDSKLFFPEGLFPSFYSALELKNGDQTRVVTTLGQLPSSIGTTTLDFEIQKSEPSDFKATLSGVLTYFKSHWEFHGTHSGKTSIIYRDVYTEGQAEVSYSLTELPEEILTVVPMLTSTPTFKYAESIQVLNQSSYNAFLSEHLGNGVLFFSSNGVRK